MHKPMHLSSCGWRCCTTTVTHAQTVSPHMAFKPDVPSSWLTFVTVYFSAALSQHHLLLSHLLLPLLPVWPPRSCQLLLQQPAGFQLQVRTKTYPESSGLSVILQSEKQIFFFFYRTDENNSSTNQESALSPQGGASGEARRYQKKKHVTQVFWTLWHFFFPLLGLPGLCADPHLRQIYTHPGLSLTPPFSRLVKEYRAEVTFDTVTIRIRPVPVSSGCQVHLDEHRGPRWDRTFDPTADLTSQTVNPVVDPRMVNYPLGLGSSRINILVTDDSDPEPEVLTVYTVHVSRENRPSLPMFSDHVTCSFLQVDDVCFQAKQHSISVHCHVHLLLAGSQT